MNVLWSVVVSKVGLTVHVNKTLQISAFIGLLQTNQILRHA